MSRGSIKILSALLLTTLPTSCKRNTTEQVSSSQSSITIEIPTSDISSAISSGNSDELKKILNTLESRGMVLPLDPLDPLDPSEHFEQKYNQSQQVNFLDIASLSCQADSMQVLIAHLNKQEKAGLLDSAELVKKLAKSTNYIKDRYAESEFAKDPQDVRTKCERTASAAFGRATTIVTVIEAKQNQQKPPSIQFSNHTNP